MQTKGTSNLTTETFLAVLLRKWRLHQPEHLLPLLSLSLGSSDPSQRVCGRKAKEKQRDGQINII